MESTMRIEMQHEKRRETDRRISFGLFVLFSILTLGIYGLVAYWRFINRRDQHFERQRLLFKNLADYLGQAALDSGKDIRAELSEVDMLLEEVESQERARNPWLWLILSFIPYVGAVSALYTYYFLNSDFAAHARREARLVRLFSTALSKLGRLSAPLVKEASFPERSFWLYFLFTILTFGLFGFYWAYTICSDPNNHFDEQDDWEATIMTAVHHPGASPGAIT